MKRGRKFLVRLSRRLLGLSLLLVLDFFLPQLPDELHPVAKLGGLIDRMSTRLRSPTRAKGAVVVLFTATVATVFSFLLPESISFALMTQCFAARQLRKEVEEVLELLERRDSEAARLYLKRLVGRDTRSLDEGAICAALLESLAENTNDSVVAPLFFYLAAGPAGAWLYRSINTCDAMLGHFDEKNRDLGRVPARLDDLASLVPALLTAALIAWETRSIGLFKKALRDGLNYPSFNAGTCEGAFAHALAVRLGGPARYGAYEVLRAYLGAERSPGPEDVKSAIKLQERLCLRVAVGAFALGLLLAQIEKVKEKGKKDAGALSCL